jgi:NADH:ubiquinone oxidoreductase subunit K
MLAVNYLLLAAVLFCIGVFGVIARRNAVLVLMSIELILAAVNLNFVAFAMMNDNIDGQVFALFVIAIAAAEVGVGLAMVLMIYRNRKSIALDTCCARIELRLVPRERLAYRAHPCHRLCADHWVRQEDADEGFRDRSYIDGRIARDRDGRRYPVDAAH